MRRHSARSTMLAAVLALASALGAAAHAQDQEPQGGGEARPGVAAAAADDAGADEARERALRTALVAAGDDVAARNVAAAALSAWLEPRGRFLEAAGLRRLIRESDPSAENTRAEARALLGFAEQVLSSGGGGAGVRAAFEDVRIALVRARDAGADDAETALGLARCAAAQGLPDAEIRELARATERWPGDDRPRRALGFAYLNAGRHAEAVPVLQALSDAAPGDVLLARALSYSAQKTGLDDVAVAAALRAIAVAPERPEGWQALWAVFAPQKRYGELARIVLAEAARYPESASAAHYAGFALSSARRPDEALVWLEKAWTLNPDNVEARLQAARLLLTERNDEKGAAEQYRAALERAPGNAGALDGLAYLAVKLGGEQRHAAALPYFRDVAQARADDGRSWANYALALRWAGHYEAAVAAYERAVANDPGDAQIRNDYGLLLLVMDRDDDAARVFVAAHDVDPLANDCVENLGFMARARGDLGEARKWFGLAWDAARRRGDDVLLARHRRTSNDVRFPLPPLR